MSDQHEDLAEREALLAEAERIVGVGSWVWDVATNQVRWSDQLFRIFGYPLDLPPTAESFFERIHPDDVGRIREQSERTAAGSTDPAPAACRLVLPGGAIRHVELTGAAIRDARGVLTRIVGTVLDVTESRRIRLELEQANSQLRDAQRLAHVGSWRWTLADHRFVLSEELYDLLAWPRDLEPTLEGLVELVVNEHRQSVAERVEGARRGVAPSTFDVSLTCLDGVLRHFEATMRPLFDDDGAVSGAWGTLHDITERRRLEGQFLQSQKLEVVGQLAGGVAHDFNNLLTVITLTTEVIARSTGHPSTRDVLAAAERAKGLTHQLLAFGRQAVAQPRRLDIVASTRAAAALLARLLGEQVDLRCDLPGEALAVVLDDTQFHQVLMNLLVNARDAMPSGGEIRLTVRRAPLDAGLVMQPPPRGPCALVEVADHGGGMDAATCARAFEPFFTTKPAGAGSGLGLATVQSIVAQAGGAIGLASKPGKGTTFRLFFPLAEPAARESTRPAAARDPAPRARRGRILLVEDEAMVANAVQAALARAGYAVEGHRRPSELLAIDHRLDPFDLLITDLVMPEMSGADLVRELSSRGHALRVLFTTGYAPERLQRALGPDAVVLTKPFGSDTLLAAVDKILSSAVSR